MSSHCTCFAIRQSFGLKCSTLTDEKSGNLIMKWEKNESRTRVPFSLWEAILTIMGLCQRCVSSTSHSRHSAFITFTAILVIRKYSVQLCSVHYTLKFTQTHSHVMGMHRKRASRNIIVLRSSPWIWVSVRARVEQEVSGKFIAPSS